MTKSALKIVENQNELIFNAVENAGRKALAAALKKSPHSRATIASRMTDILQIEITEDMINNWTSMKPTHRIPLFWAHAFCMALDTDDFTAFDIALGPTNRRLATPEEVRHSQIGKKRQALKQLEAEIATLEGQR